MRVAKLLVMGQQFVHVYPKWHETFGYIYCQDQGTLLKFKKQYTNTKTAFFPIMPFKRI